MYILSAGTDDIVSESGVTIGAIYSTTVIEASYLNQSLSYTVTYKCPRCSSGYVYRLGSCFPYSSSASKGLGIFILCIIILTFFIMAIISCKSSTSMQSYWSMISQMQMLFLLLTRWLTSDDIREVIRVSNITMNPYYYIPLSKNKIYDSLFSQTDVGLTDSFIEDVGIYSDSSLFNTFPIFTCLFYIIIFHIVLYIIHKRVMIMNENGNWIGLTKFIKWLVNETYKVMNFRFYIRNLLLLCQFVLICSFYDIVSISQVGVYRILCLIFAALLLLFYIAVAIVILYLIFSRRQANARIIEKLNELFSGIKELKCQQLYLVIFFIRRMVYALFFVCLKFISSEAVIGIITHFQFYYIIFVLSRPYKEVIVNIIEISNEIFFFIMICLLNFFYQNEPWSSLNTGLFVTLIVLNVFSNFFIISIHGVIILIKSINEKRLKLKIILYEKMALLRNQELQVIRRNNNITEPVPENQAIPFGQPIDFHSLPVSKKGQKSPKNLNLNELEESKYNLSESINKV